MKGIGSVHFRCQHEEDGESAGSTIHLPDRSPDTYNRRCAITSEHTLPVLEAAHIKPVSNGGEHSVTNGLLLRSDVHTLFDRGYVTVTPDRRFRVSHSLNDRWKNGKIYYALDGKEIFTPKDASCFPDRELLEWHADTVFLK